MSGEVSYAYDYSAELPKGWSAVPMGEIATIVAGVGFPKDLQGQKEGNIPVFKVGDISKAWRSGHIRLVTSPNYLTEEEVSSIKAKLLPAATTVFAKIGEALKLNRRAMLGCPSIIDNNVMGLIPAKDVVHPYYLFYFMRTVDLGALSRATAVPSVRKTDVQDILVPLAPIDQQKRIVAEIEKQFSRLDEGIDNLKRVQANLKRYKAAVLRAAVEGRLVETEAEIARREGRDFETGEQLLQRILQERRRRWEEAELAKMQAKGKPPKNDKWKQKYKEPAAPDTTNLPELPEGWVWATVGALGDVIGGLTKNPKRLKMDKKYPYLRVANIYANELRLDEIEEIGVEDGELEKLLVRKGDLLIVEGNGSPDQIGRLAIWDGSITPCVHQNHLIKVRLYSGCSSYWALNWMMSPEGRRYVRDVSSSTSGLYTLSVGKTSRLPTPLPPRTEQHRIVTKIDRRLSILRETEAQVEANLQRAERLRQSLLAQAFAGALP